MFQQRLGDHAPESKLFRHAYHHHAEQEGQDAPQRQQRCILRPLEHQRNEEAVADQHQRVHSHQQAVEKAAAPPEQNPCPACLFQHQHHYRRARKLLQGAVEVGVHRGEVRPGEQQNDRKDEIRHEQSAQKQNFRQNAEQNGMRRAQTFEHGTPPVY